MSPPYVQPKVQEDPERSGQNSGESGDFDLHEGHLVVYYLQILIREDIHAEQAVQERQNNLVQRVEQENRSSLS